MNTKMTNDIFDIMSTINEAIETLKEYCVKRDDENFYSISDAVGDGLTSIINMSDNIEPKRLVNGCICAYESLVNINKDYILKKENVLWKIDNELQMIVEGTIIDFYCDHFFDYTDEGKTQLQQFLLGYGNFKRLLIPEKDREYEVDLTIFVPAYNQVKYTEMCIESVMANLPESCTYEVILYNHGSTDETKAVFEKDSRIKLINTKINRAHSIVGMRSVKGKYLLFISNDIIVGKNAIENMYRAISTHEDYGWIVPSTSNVSNGQTIEISYNNLEEFEEFTEKNNVYDEKRHEMRVRLCDPVHIWKTDLYNQMAIEMYDDLYCVKDISSFPDDKHSLWMRRNGLKSILQKDAFCHHYGSITHRYDRKKEEWSEFYKQGRIAFLNKWGIDPWGAGIGFEKDLVEKISNESLCPEYVVGIESGLGGNPLKVRELIKEQGATIPKLVLITKDRNIIIDIQGLADEVFIYDDEKEIAEYLANKRSVILIENMKQKDGVLADILKNKKDVDLLLVKQSFDNWQKIDV